MFLYPLRALRGVGRRAFALLAGPARGLLAGAVHGVATGLTLATPMRGVANGACPDVSCEAPARLF